VCVLFFVRAGYVRCGLCACVCSLFVSWVCCVCVVPE